MKCKRLAAAVMAMAFSISCTGCALGDQIAEKLLGIENYELTQEQQSARFDVDGLQAQAKAMSETWTRDGLEADLQTQLEAMVDAIDEAAEVYFTHEMAYYADWEDDAKIAMYNQTYEDYYVAFEILYWVLCNGYSKSAYGDLFQSYLGDDVTNTELIEYYTTTTLDRVVMYGRSDSAYYSGALEEYYEVSSDDSLSSEDADLQCAEMYLENLKTYDTTNYLYDYYARDYEAAEVSALYDIMSEELLPLYDALYETMIEHPYYEDLYTDAYGVDDLFGTIQTYAAQISPELEASAKKLNDEKWYVLGEGEDCYTGSYCISMPGKQKALLYIYQNGEFFDLYTAIHEFGHFHAEWSDETSMFEQENCVDIAEVHSQGLSMLFTAYYDDLFGQAADYLELVTLFDMVDSIVCGLAIGEFEYRVMQELDTITAEEVVELFYEINETCNTGYMLKDISHLYEQPGYYVSYAISAIPAMQIYNVMQEDYDSAVAMYEAMAELSSCDGVYQINSAMTECGFADIFAPETLQGIAAKIEQQLAEIDAAA